MTKYQVFLIVVFLFFFGSGGGWVLELFFRRLRLDSYQPSLVGD